MTKGIDSNTAILSRKREIILNIIFWLVYYFMVYLDDVLPGTYSLHANLSFFLTSNIFLFYSFTYCFKVFSRKSALSIVVGVSRFLLVCAIYLYLRVFVRHIFLPYVFNDLTWSNYSFAKINHEAYTWIVNYFIIASGYYFYSSSIKKEHKIRVAAQEKAANLERMAKLELEKSQFEQAFLRAQINPHFLFNTLNFIYVEASGYSKELAGSIFRLSEIMRYTLNDDINKIDKVPLQKEIDYIHNYIALNQLRFNNQLCIDFGIQGQTSGLMIPPMILMTFLENVFKHGELRDKEHPVSICFDLNPGQMKFRFCNRPKQNLLNENSTGIGIENIRRRLKYIYGDKFDLETKKDEHSFSVSLSLFS